MKRWLNPNCMMVLGCLMACNAAGIAEAKLPPPSDAQKAMAAAAKAKAPEKAKKQAAALSKAQDRAVENYKRGKYGTLAPTAAVKKSVKRKHARRVERLACRLGTEDRHARIAVEVVNGAIQNFAYYAKWKPRTCSVYIVRDDAYSTWKDQGRFTTVTTEKGSFIIENKRKNIHFIFKDVERERYCGADGKINGTLTVWRGKKQCELNGMMDNDPNETVREPPTANRSEAAVLEKTKNN